MKNFLYLTTIALIALYSCSVSAGDIEKVTIKDAATAVQSIGGNSDLLEYGNFFSADYVFFSGPILDGDTKKIIDFIEQEFGQLSTRSNDIFIFLDSPGGSFYEGIAMAEYFYDQAIKTIIWESHSCYSACAIAFMGGHSERYRNTGGPLRYLHTEGVLGFHAPYYNLEYKNLPFSKVDLDIALAAVGEGFTSGLNAASELLLQSETLLYSYELLQATLKVSPEHLYYIDTAKKHINNHIIPISVWKPQLEMNETIAGDVCRYWFHYNGKGYHLNNASKETDTVYSQTGHRLDLFPTCYVIKANNSWLVGLFKDDESPFTSELSSSQMKPVSKFMKLVK